MINSILRGLRWYLWIARKMCWVIGHDYRVYAQPRESWGKGVLWLRCMRCQQDYAINTHVRVILPMDDELRDMHEWELLPYPDLDKHGGKH